MARGKPRNNVEAGFGQRLRAEALRDQFARMGAVFVYDLAETDQIALSLAPPGSPENLSRQLAGQLVGRDVFRILEDSADGEWVGKTLSFGTYAAAHGPITFIKPGILRGFIARGGCVTVDLAGQDFFEAGADIQYYPDTYAGLSVNDTKIF